MFFQSENVDVKILSVIQMGWQRVNARAGYRPFYTLSYRLVGDAAFFTEGKDPLQVYEDEITFVPAGYDFSKQAGTGKIIAVHFTSDEELPGKILRFSPGNAQYFRSNFQKLLEIWTKKDIGYAYEAKILLYRIMLEMEREWAEDRSSSTARQLRPAVEYIAANYTRESVSVAHLAKLCGMSDTYLRRLFVREFGMTPQRYISRLRLSAARELLQSGYYSIGEIADRCGFNNINYFSTFIKKETGMSPEQYRKTLLESRTI